MNSVTEKVLEKYPEYRDTPYADLTLKLAERYPQYLERPDFAEDVRRFEVFKPRQTAEPSGEKFDISTWKPDPTANAYALAEMDYVQKYGVRPDPYGAHDTELITALATGAQSAAKKVGGVLHAAGKVLVGGAADFGEEMTGGKGREERQSREALEEARQQAGPELERLDAAFTKVREAMTGGNVEALNAAQAEYDTAKSAYDAKVSERFATNPNAPETGNLSVIAEAVSTGRPIGTLPAESDLKVLPTPLRVVGRASQGLIQTAPQLAGVAGMQALGVPAPLAAAAVFGMTEDGFDPKQAAIAAAIPYVGKYSGEVTGLIAKRLGISSERALQIYNDAGGAAGATAYLGTIQTSEILTLPPEQRREATIEAIANNIAMLPLAFSAGGKPGTKTLAEKVDQIATVAPLTAEALKLKLGEAAQRRISLEPTGERIPVESRRTEINLMERRGDIQQFITELDAIETRMRDATAAEKESARVATIKKFEAQLQQIGRPEKPVVPEGPAPEQRMTVVEEIRRANALTIRQIQDLFPKAQLNRERARELRNAAWGEPEPQTALTPEPVAPKVEADAPANAPAPVSRGAATTADILPAGKTVPEPATPETAATTKSPLLDPEAVSKMSPTDFVDKLTSEGTQATKAGYDLAKSLKTPQDRARLAELEAQARAESGALLKQLEDAAPADRERLFNEQQKASAKVQYFNEAGRMFDAVHEAAAKLGVDADELAPPRESTSMFDPSQVATVEVPLEKLKLSQDVPNFKADASPETGVVAGQQLQGKFERVGVAPIIVWERLNGDLEVISGRHRLDLARRSGEKTIPSQIVRESHGFTKDMALTLDAESNIRDGQGSVEDYALYFKNTEISEAEARARGLLSRVKGQTGWHLAKNASSDLYAAWKAGKLSDAQAAAIAAEAPGNADLQRVALPSAIRGQSPQHLTNLVRAVKSESGGSTKQLDLLGNDDAAMKKMEEMAERATAAQRDLVEQVRSVQSAAKRPEAAKKLGVDVSDPEGVLRRVNEIKAELDRWQNWPLHPDLVSKVRGTPEAAPAPVPAVAVAEPPAKPAERSSGELFAKEETPFNLSSERATAPAPMVEPSRETTLFGEETLSQPEMFGIEKVVSAKDPAKSADAAQVIHGDPAVAAKVIERQLRVIDSDPVTRKAFTKEQRQRLREVVSLLRERAGGGESEVSGAISKPGPGLSPSPAPAAPVLTVKSQSQIIRDLSKGLNIPIRFGRLRTNKFAGYFLRKSNLIGSRRPNDLPIVTHEVGHKIDATLGMSRHPAINSELMHLGDPTRPDSRSSWTPGKTLDYRRGEGVAEFIRYWITDPVQAVRLAPHTNAYFESALAVNKDLRDVLTAAQEDVRVWRNAPPQARLRSQISVGGNPNRTPYRLDQLTRDVVDDLHYMRLAVDDAQRGAAGRLDPSKNPYVLARNLRGSFGMADTFIQRGAVDFATKEVRMGTGLQQALEPVAGRINDFRDWIVAKQALELRRQGKATGLVPSDVDAVVAKFDGDAAFQEAFTKVKAWNDSLLQYAVDSGYVSPAAAAAMRRLNQDYVPFHRVFEVGAGEMGQESAGTGRGLNVGKASSLKGRHGSSRDIVDPLETMVKNAYSLITASEKNAISIALADLGGRQDMGRWVERIATPKDAHRVTLAKLREQLEDAGADVSMLPDDLLLSFYTSSSHAPFGENIIKVNRSGNLEFYRLKPELFDTFHALDMDSSGTLLKILSAPAQLLRAGVTTTPDFALMNAMRDTVNAAVISRYGVLPFESTIRGVAAMIGDRKLVAEWAASGGKQAIEVSYFDRDKLQHFLREKITKDLTPAERASIVVKSPLMALRLLTGTLEEATRIGEYQVGVNKFTREGMSIGDARRLAAFEARDLQDFAKGGAKTKILRQMTPFWNAQLQGMVRFAQAIKERPGKTVLSGLAFITLPKMIEQAVNWNDDDYWDRPQWERDLFFLIPYGKDDNGRTKFIRIPTPFEPGLVFGTVPGRFMQWAKTHKPEAVTSLPGVIARNTIPNPIPPVVLVAFENFLSGEKGWSVWRGRTIVPESLSALPPELQFTEQTSLTAKKLGRALHFSPMKIDSIIASTTGGLGKQVVHQGIDRGISAATGEERTASRTMPGERFFTTPAGITSQAVDDFYAKLETLRKESARERRADEESTMDLSDLPAMERDARYITELMKEARETKDETERQKIFIEIADVAKGWAQ